MSLRLKPSEMSGGVDSLNMIGMADRMSGAVPLAIANWETLAIFETPMDQNQAK